MHRYSSGQEAGINTPSSRAVPRAYMQTQVPHVWRREALGGRTERPGNREMHPAESGGLARDPARPD